MAAAPDPIRYAIVQRLSATSAVTSLLSAPGAVWHRQAPRNATPPYIVLHRQSEVDRWTFSGPPLEDELWTVKGISRGTSDAADSISKAITAALNDAALTITGYGLLYLRRESKVDYGEPDGDQIWNHVGGIFRVDAQPA